MLVIAVITFAIMHTRGVGHSVLLTLRPFGDFVDLSIPISNTLTIRAVLVTISICSLSSYLIYDYSKFFPRHFEFDAFYNEDGVDEALRSIPLHSLSGLEIPNDLKVQRQVWLKHLDEEVAAATQVDELFFTLPGGNVRAYGKTEFHMVKCRGIQHYKIEVSEGLLTTELDRPGKASRIVGSQFARIATHHDHIFLSLNDFFLRRGTILRTLYKQALRSHTNENLSHFDVVGITPVTIFPWPRIGKTVYFALIHGLAIPFGFAIYK